MSPLLPDEADSHRSVLTARCVLVVRARLPLRERQDRPLIVGHEPPRTDVGVVGEHVVLTNVIASEIANPFMATTTGSCRTGRRCR